MAEAIEFINKEEGKETDMIGFIKKFNKLKSKEARELKQEIERMNIIKNKTGISCQDCRHFAG